MLIKSFQQYINEAESVDMQSAPSDEELKDIDAKMFKTKEQRLGYTSNSKEIIAKLKVGHTIELTPEDFKALANMKVTQYESDMYEHTRGGKDYKIKKDKRGKFTIFHYHKTLHRLTPVGVFRL